MFRNRAAYLFYPAIAAVAAGLTVVLQYAHDHWLRPGPVLVYTPSVIDLGSRDRGELVVAHFAIRNSGGCPLVVDQFTTSCSCAGVEREVDGKSVRVESVHVPPGGTAELFVRIAVNNAIGDSVWLQISFRSNDPRHSVGQIDITVPLVMGGISPWPRAVVFGSVPVHTTAQKVVELYDAGALGRQVAGARSLQPERFAVRILPVRQGESTAAGNVKEVLIARLEVTARTERDGPLDGEIEVELVNETRAPCRIPVTGEVVSAIECQPRFVVLPRRVAGRTVFNNELVIQTRAESPLDVRILAAPPWLRVDIRGVPGRPDQRVIFVEGTPESSPRAGDSCLRLGARPSGGDEQTVVIPITVAEIPP